MDNAADYSIKMKRWITHFVFIVMGSTIFFVGCKSTQIESTSFVPDIFTAPLSYTSDSFLIEKLTLEHAAKDYEAVMESRLDLRRQFGGSWPEDTFSLEQNIKDIKEHEHLFEKRISFTYSILSTDGEHVLGCIYINPIDSANFDAQVHMWVRSGEKYSNLRTGAKKELASWLYSQWPFEEVLIH